MSDLFTTQNEVTKDQCEQYARMLIGSSVKPVAWQGFHSYTLLSASGTIIQFRSKASPLDALVAEKAKAIHAHLAPTTSYHSTLPNSSVTVWLMEALPGIGYLFEASCFTPDKRDVTIIDLAKFYAESWRNAENPVRNKIHFYNKKLDQLLFALPARFMPVIKLAQNRLAQLIGQVPWVLTHQDLSNMNMLVDADSGHLTGIVDWADATVEPFGVALWGLESILGCSGPAGWSYYAHDHTESRRLFQRTLLCEIGEPLPNETCRAIDELRTLGVLLRYGFTWEYGVERIVDDTSLLDEFLKTECKLMRQIPSLDVTSLDLTSLDLTNPRRSIYGQLKVDR